MTPEAGPGKADKPNPAPYTAQPNQIPLDTLNGTAPAAPAAAKTMAKAWSSWSAQQDWSGPDRANPAQLNRADWYATHQYTQPYPGDRTVLTPAQVSTPPGQAPTNSDD